MKLLGVSQEPSGDWLLLARILALYGDATGAKHFIRVAKKERRKHGETRDTKAYWKRCIQDIEDIINSEVNKKKIV